MSHEVSHWNNLQLLKVATCHHLLLTPPLLLLLLAAAAVLDDLGVQYFADFGTLLGMYREVRDTTDQQQGHVQCYEQWYKQCSMAVISRRWWLAVRGRRSAAVWCGGAQ